MKILHLVCNSHLDPVWLWMWEEGAAEALSTFRTAACFCDEFGEFVFCHNESLLYKWVEELEPELHEKIKGLVEEKRWHIMGGWFLQPDCNLPSGESFVRQILIGKKYFMQEFGYEPKTAVNFDPFGHSRGLVQILKKSGYKSYLFCRPDPGSLSLPSDDFVWVGYDGSEILAHRAPNHYNSEHGKVEDKILNWIKQNKDKKFGLLLWGVGDHGGGASREDLHQIRFLIKEQKKWEIRHSRPEDYFLTLEKYKNDLPHYKKDLNPWAVGCYTTMARIKQSHRQLENSFFLTEKISSHAAMQNLIDYPHSELQKALEDLLFCEFHDILPGSSIPEVEEQALQKMDHGMEILSRLKFKAFMSLLSGEPSANEGEYPIFVYNPHPFAVNEDIVCELQPYQPNWEKETMLVPEIEDEHNRILPSQIEKESSNIADEWRKRVVFPAVLAPGKMQRFSCRLRKVETGPETKKFKNFESQSSGSEIIEMTADQAKVVVNRDSGLVDAFEVQGRPLLLPNSFRCLVIEDYSDPWGMRVDSFRNVLGQFKLLNENESAEMAGISSRELDPVRIIEDGPVRIIVEALFKYNCSFLCLRYTLSKKNSMLGLELRVYWNEKDKMLKLSIPTTLSGGVCRGQVAYGVQEFMLPEKESIAQKWVGFWNNDNSVGVAVINEGTYGFDHQAGELRLSLLRSAAYAAHPTAPENPIVPQDRFEPRIDQGERIFRFWIEGGKGNSLWERLNRDALVKHEKPFALCCSPPGSGKKILPGIRLEDNCILLTAAKFAEDTSWLIIRLFEPTGKKRKTQVVVPVLNLTFPVALKPFEIKTIAIDLDTKEIFETDLLERPLT